MDYRALIAWGLVVELLPTVIDAIGAELERRHDRHEREKDRAWETEALAKQLTTEAQLRAAEMELERKENEKSRRCARDVARIEAEATIQAAESGGKMIVLKPDDDAGEKADAAT
jgi:ClpP class serine protease